jgi:hypothetical protein
VCRLENPLLKLHEEEVGWLIDAIVESEYMSSCCVSSGETPVTLAYVIADIKQLNRLAHPTL